MAPGQPVSDPQRWPGPGTCCRCRAQPERAVRTLGTQGSFPRMFVPGGQGARAAVAPYGLAKLVDWSRGLQLPEEPSTL